jgi:hypothetical protein
VETEGAQYFLEFVWAWDLLSARALLPLIGAGLHTKLVNWVGVNWVGGAFGWAREEGGGGGQEMSEGKLAEILYRLGLAAYAAAALLAWATCSGHSLDHAVCLPLQFQQE